MKSQNSDQYLKTYIQLSFSEKAKAKEIARSNGMTFSGWLGRLVKDAINATEHDPAISETYTGSGYGSASQPPRENT